MTENTKQIVQKAESYLLNKCKVYFLIKKFSKYKKIIQYKEQKINIKKLFVYEKKWKKINKTYKKINIYGMNFMGIGETIPRLFMYLRHMEQKDKTEYHLVLPIFYEEYTQGLTNDRIFDVFAKKISFVTKKNIEFWLYVCILHSPSVSIKNFDEFLTREEKGFEIELGKPLLPFYPQIEDYGKKRLQEMGVEEQYICIHARESAKKNVRFPGHCTTQVVDANIDTFNEACEYMKDLGYKIVRLGKDEEKITKIKGIIDYARYFHDDLMDFYLLKNCKFILASAAGITAIAQFWGRPVLYTNLLPLTYGFESMATTAYDLYIPKKCYSKRKGRFLNLYEVLDISDKCDRYDIRYQKMGIEVIDNTNEEILKAAKEMNQRMEGTWFVSEAEKIHISRYWKIMDLWKKSHKTSRSRKLGNAEGYRMIPAPICYSYLKNNLYLLDLDL